MSDQPAPAAPAPTALVAQPVTQDPPAKKGQSWEPSNMAEGFKYAEWLAKSNIIPRYLQNKPHDVMVVALAGRDYGLTFTQAMSSVIVVEGRVALAAALIVGLVKKHPECLYFQLIESDDKHAIWETHRRGHPAPTRRQFTIEDAAKMNLSTRDNWKKQPQTMLTWRAATHLARFEYPDVVLNLLDIEEAGDSGLLKAGAGAGTWMPPEPEKTALPAAPVGNAPAAPAATPKAAAPAATAAKAAPAAPAPAPEAKRGPGRPRKAPEAPAAKGAEPTQDALSDAAEETEADDPLAELGDGEGPLEPTEDDKEAMAIDAMDPADQVKYFGKRFVELAAQGLAVGPPESDWYHATSVGTLISYWNARIGFAKDTAELRAMAVEVRGLEPDGSEVRKGLTRAYTERMRQFDGGKK